MPTNSCRRALRISSGFPMRNFCRRIKEHVPLFNGELPLSGRMPDEVSDVLQAMLVEKAIPGHVDYVRGRQAGRPGGVRSATSVSEVLIRVRNIEFTGAGEAEKLALEAAAQRFQDREFSRSRLDLLVQRDLLPDLQRARISQGFVRRSSTESRAAAAVESC